MNDQQEFFSAKHKQLLNIATWAKYLAWVVMVVFVGWAVAIFFQRQIVYTVISDFSPAPGLVDLFRQYPAYAIGVVVEMISVILQGGVYFLVLRGLALGLNMIVETDINYREQKGDVE